ncbi:hypothetical protein HDU76_006918 [Blyttiomyces sp. JEL0837]|nr:hypothetical protein HDU76_006918 [Blyttiomyces sp. JEL0837]
MTPFLRLMVIRRILLLNDGRDKVLKVLQYGAKAILWLQLIEKASTLFTEMRSKLAPHQMQMLDMLIGAPSTNGQDEKGSPKSQTLQSRLGKLIPHLSMARKIVRMFHFLEPIDTLMSFNFADLKPEKRPTQSPTNTKSSLNKSKNNSTDHPLLTPIMTTKTRLAWLTLIASIAGIANDVSDDTIAFSKMGILDKSWSKWCAPISDRLWMTSIFIDLHEICMDYISLNGKLRALDKRLDEATTATLVAMANQNQNQGNQKQLSKRQSQLSMPSLADRQVHLDNERQMIAAEREKIMNKFYVHRLSLIKLSADFVFCGAHQFP